MATAIRRTAGRSAPAPVEPPARVIKPAAARARAAKAEAGRMVTTTEAYDTETQQVEDMEVIVFPPGVEPAFVRVEAGKTINLGNYESLRLGVAITLPCMRDQVLPTFDAAAQFVADRLTEEEAEWMGTTKPKPKANRR